MWALAQVVVGPTHGDRIKIRRFAPGLGYGFDVLVRGVQRPADPDQGVVLRLDKNIGHPLIEAALVRFLQDRRVATQQRIAHGGHARGPRFRLLAFRYVRMGAGHPQGLAVGGPLHDLAAVLDPGPMPGLVAQAHLAVIVVDGSPERLLQQPVRFHEVVWMGKVDPGLDRHRGEFVQGITGDPGPALVDDQLARLHVPFPGADVGAPQDFPQAAALLGKLVFRFLLRRDVDDGDGNPARRGFRARNGHGFDAGDRPPVLGQIDGLDGEGFGIAPHGAQAVDERRAAFGAEKAFDLPPEFALGGDAEQAQRRRIDANYPDAVDQVGDQPGIACQEGPRIACFGFAHVPDLTEDRREVHFKNGDGRRVEQGAVALPAVVENFIKYPRPLDLPQQQPHGDGRQGQCDNIGQEDGHQPVMDGSHGQQMEQPDRSQMNGQAKDEQMTYSDPCRFGNAEAPAGETECERGGDDAETDKRAGPAQMHAVSGGHRAGNGGHHRAAEQGAHGQYDRPRIEDDAGRELHRHRHGENRCPAEQNAGSDPGLKWMFVSVGADKPLGEAQRQQKRGVLQQFQKKHSAPHCGGEEAKCASGAATFNL